MNLEELKEPFPEDGIEWRIGQSGIAGSGKVWAMCLAYVTARAIQDRLDEVVGAENWKDEYEVRELSDSNGNVHAGWICKLSIRINDEWITKEDGAPCTAVEAFKGGISDALKRAGVKWGIGRYLYDLESGFAQVHEQRVDGAHKAFAKDKTGSKKMFFWTAPKLPAWALPKQKRAA